MVAVFNFTTSLHHWTFKNFFQIVTNLFYFFIKTTEEINENLNGFKLEETGSFTNATFKEASGLAEPQSVDWRKDGLVGPVRNQVSSAV